MRRHNVLTLLIGAPLIAAFVLLSVGALAEGRAPDPHPAALSIRLADNPEGNKLAHELFNEARANGECVVIHTLTEGLTLWLHSCTQAQIKQGYK